jgi:hypothetical protein
LIELSIILSTTTFKTISVTISVFSVNISSAKTISAISVTISTMSFFSDTISTISVTISSAKTISTISGTISEIIETGVSIKETISSSDLLILKYILIYLSIYNFKYN